MRVHVAQARKEGQAMGVYVYRVGIVRRYTGHDTTIDLDVNQMPV